MPTVTVGTATVPYRIEGDGPAVVLVPGTGPNAEIQFGHLVKRFAEHHTVLVPDISGTEPVQDDGAALTVETLAEQVVAVVADAGIDEADLVGFSLGSAVAVAAAAARPDLVRRLVLVAAWSHAEDDEYTRNMFAVWRTLAELDAEAFGRYSTFTGFSRGFLTIIGRDEVEKIVPNLQPTPNLLRQIDLCRSLDVGPLLSQVKAETLVVGCTQDATVPAGNARAVHEGIAGSTYTEIDSGHVVVMENPDAFVEVVTGFTAAP